MRTWASITKKAAYHDEVAILRSLLALQDATPSSADFVGTSSNSSQSADGNS